MSERGPAREARARAGRRHLALAIGVSVALHAALLGAIRTGPAPAPLPPGAFTVSLVEVEGGDAATPRATRPAEGERGAPGATSPGGGVARG